MSEVVMATLGHKDAKHYARLTATDRFPANCDRIKMPKTEFVRSNELAYMTGEMAMALEFLNVLASSAEDSYEVILGEIQLLAHERWNAMHHELTKKGRKTTVKKISLETLIEQCQNAIATVREEEGATV